MRNVNACGWGLLFFKVDMHANWMSQAGFEMNLCSKLRVALNGGLWYMTDLEYLGISGFESIFSKTFDNMLF